MITQDTFIKKAQNLIIEIYNNQQVPKNFKKNYIRAVKELIIKYRTFLYAYDNDIGTTRKNAVYSRILFNEFLNNLEVYFNNIIPSGIINKIEELNFGDENSKDSIK